MLTNLYNTCTLVGHINFPSEVKDTLHVHVWQKLRPSNLAVTENQLSWLVGLGNYNQ